ncbi:MAG: helix-turn-helix transcriptional regulator [Lentisphaeria bacterium]|nr:helix-turn-helix transcriptional regulator [Lentisphaeria bacterium]
MNKILLLLQDSVLKQAVRLELPPGGNYHAGLKMPEHLELPDNILCFCHNFPSPEYAHRRYCIVIPFDRIEYVLNGETLNVFPGTAVFQRPYAAHCIRAGQKSCRRLQISFDLTSGQEQEYIPDRDVTVEMNMGTWRRVARILKLFLKHDAASCALEVYRLCRELKGRTREESPAHKGQLMDEVEHMTEFRRTRRENIKSIAEHMKMSESNLRLKFRKENGISLGSFLRQNKLEIAKYRLEYTRQTVGEIARICGYDSQFSFSRFFKNKTGLSPLRWRKEHQAKIPSQEDPD